MEPLVSIITPAFNASRYLVSFFESVLNQDYSNYELIFINDGSTDDTAQIALRYKKSFEEKGHRFVYLAKENGGQAAALNTGFPYMKGKYFIWPDSDDTLCSDNLSAKVDFMEENPSIDLGIAWAKHVDENGSDLGILKRIPVENDDLFRDLLVSNNVQFCPGIYIIRRRLLIGLLEKANAEQRYDFVKDILVRYRETKKIYGYEMPGYWNNIATVDSYYRTNMDFLKKDVRDYFFGGYAGIYSKVEDQPPAKFNPGASVRNSLVASGCIINGKVENSVLFRKVYVGNNCVIRNSIILNDVYIGDNTTIENCIVESRGTIRANETYRGEDGKVRIVVEENERYII